MLSISSHINTYIYYISWGLVNLPHFSGNGNPNPALVKISRMRVCLDKVVYLIIFVAIHTY